MQQFDFILSFVLKQSYA